MEINRIRNNKSSLLEQPGSLSLDEDDTADKMDALQATRKSKNTSPNKPINDPREIKKISKQIE